jgi:hypothetical protein
MTPVGYMHVIWSESSTISVWAYCSSKTKDFFFLLASLPPPDANFSRVVHLTQLGEMDGRGGLRRKWKRRA